MRLWPCITLAVSLLVTASSALADDAEPSYTVAAGVGVGNYDRVVVDTLQLAAGVRIKGLTIWYVRGDLGHADDSTADYGPDDGRSIELRTGPVWRTCWTGGCHGISLELGIQRMSGFYTYVDYNGPPQLLAYDMVSYFLVSDVRWRGELYVYRDGLLSLEGNLGFRIGVRGAALTDPETDIGPTITSMGGIHAGLAVIVRR